MSRFYICVFCLFSIVFCYAQVNIKVISIPNNTPQPVNIYIAGTMNNWNPGNADYKLVADSLGQYTITFTPAIGAVKFKFTQGSWATVEGISQGGFIPDRSINYNGQPINVELSIAGWEGSGSITSTASPQVSILSEAFNMPQLNRKRKIWLYLPKDYQNSQKKFPVLYMHDGQNLFDKTTSFSGEWRVDESLDSMILAGDYGCIVVGIDNGGANRLNEYSPWVNTQYGGGQGDEYVEFIVETLKPYIDQNYRTLSDADNTGIMGSSMGGLISMYAGIKYPEVFGRVGAFSSSFWFSDQSYKQVEGTGVSPNSYFYLIAGSQEGGDQVEDMNEMVGTLKSKGAEDINVFSQAHADGKHSEWYWEREFPKAYKWLFEKKTSTLNDFSDASLKVWQSGNILFISSIDEINGKQVSLYDIVGRQIGDKIIGQNQITLDTSFNTGIYFLKIEGQKGGVKFLWQN
ncbi:MAG TPA: alpha/beta hydrolase-fold protein [Saprospiraceae bacterium]|nr:alpha/beta hydrolase-fold protein [Saprospiraceae bacterium]HMU02340.1 alpha/beta hydrolase-fold protein [Saprospiraceae bacterium]